MGRNLNYQRAARRDHVRKHGSISIAEERKIPNKYYAPPRQKTAPEKAPVETLNQAFQAALKRRKIRALTASLQAMRTPSKSTK
jgi:hypothetical protein